MYEQIQTLYLKSTPSQLTLRKIYDNLQIVYEDEKINKTLSPDQKELLNIWFLKKLKITEDAENENISASLLEIQQKIQGLSERIGSNIVSEVTNKLEEYKEYITNEEDLEGLSIADKNYLKDLAIKNGHPDKWLITFKEIGYLLTTLNNKPLRKKLYRNFAQLNFQGNYDNSDLILQIINLRDQEAKLLNYNNYVEYRLGKKQFTALKELLEYVKELGKKLVQKDATVLKQLAKEDGVLRFQNWDIPFYQRKREENLYVVEEQLVPKEVFQNQNIKPHAYIFTNFLKENDNTPLLLESDQVLDLFHEFGHALHMLFSRLHFSEIDLQFKEFPSLLMEKWAFHKDSVRLFAKHYKTGEVIPDSLIERLNVYQNTMEVQETVEAIRSIVLDFSWHTSNPKQIKSVRNFEHRVLKDLLFLPYGQCNLLESCKASKLFGPESIAIQTHMYLLSQIYADEFFKQFEGKGVFDKPTANSLKKLLQKGGALKKKDFDVTSF